MSAPSFESLASQQVTLKPRQNQAALTMRFAAAFEHAMQAFNSGQLQQAFFFTAQLRQQVPSSIDLLWLTACVYDALSVGFDQRLALCDEALQLEPSHNEFCQMKAYVLRLAGRCNESIQWLQQSISRNGDVASLFLELGQGYLELGSKVEAETALRRALQLDNELAAAWFCLIDLVQFSQQDLTQMLQLYGASQLHDSERTQLAFTIAAYWRQRAEIGNEVEWLHHANALQKKQQPYRREHNRKIVEQHIRLSCADDVPTDISRALKGSDPVPVFIVGMPRTGSTLVEQILASHSDVTATGESCCLEYCLQQLSGLPPGSGIQPSLIPEIPQHQFRSIREQYFSLVKKTVTTSYFTDKSLDNYRVVSLLRQVFPEAKIVYTTRFPLDIFLSCYQRNFSRLPFTNNLVDLAEYYVDFQHLMSHWSNTLTTPYLELPYEQLVAEPETTARELLGYCGLEWQDRALEFTSNTQVRTASRLQVREKVHNRSVGGWRAYRSMLQVAIDVLLREELVSERGLA